MDRLKSISKPKWIPGANSDKHSYDDASMSRNKKPILKAPLESVKSFIPGRSSSPTEATVARPISALPDISQFGPPPKRTDTSPAPPLPAGTKRPPPVPPRRNNGSFPEPKEVTDEDIRTTGGLNTTALSRLQNAGVSVPGFETTSTANAPAQGTTWEEKRKAAETAQKFQKDPTSVSFSDARAAVGTARNFQQRHGEQVKAGTRMAGDLNERHGDRVTGLAAKHGIGISGGATQRNLPLPPSKKEDAPAAIGRFSMKSVSKAMEGQSELNQTSSTASSMGRSPPLLPLRRISSTSISVGSSSPSTVNPSSSIEPRPSPSLPVRRIPSANSTTLSSAIKKPPPPPPPLKKKPPPLPSRPRLTTHIDPSMRHPQHGDLPPNFGLPESIVRSSPRDLQIPLNTPWFTNLYEHSGLPGLPYPFDNYQNISWRSRSTSETSLRGTTHTLRLTLLWTLNLSKTEITITWQSRDPLNTARISQCHTAAPSLPFEGPVPAVANWCEGKMGHVVGNGECWTLAQQALKNTPGIMESQGVTHGCCFWSSWAGGLMNQISRGDILQFYEAEFANGTVAGSPGHTAVVAAAVGSNGEVEVLECNSNGSKKVQKGRYDLNQIVRGGVRAFRPVSERHGPFHQ